VSEDTPVEVVAAIIRETGGNRILLSQRRSDSHLGGFWEFPGGKVEPGESRESALIREVMEELGIRVKIGLQVLEQSHRYPDRYVRVHFYECRILEGSPVALEAIRLAWCPPQQLHRYRMPEANTRVVEVLQSPAIE
jgi:8-oxo-dGTP diphosphatase